MTSVSPSMNTFYGVYRGLVTNNIDPESLFRLKAQIPQVTGTQESDWAWPCFPPGWSQNVETDHTFTDYNDGTASSGNKAVTLTHTLKFQTPPVGQGVWIMFEGGDPHKPVWVGTWLKL